MATVNAFALLMNRAHTELIDDEFVYEKAYENPSSGSEREQLQIDPAFETEGVVVE